MEKWYLTMRTYTCAVPFLAVICLFIIVNKMYMKATSCLCLHPQLLCKDLIEKDKKKKKFLHFSLQQNLRLKCIRMMKIPVDQEMTVYRFCRLREK